MKDAVASSYVHIPLTARIDVDSGRAFTQLVLVPTRPASRPPATTASGTLRVKIDKQEICAIAFQADNGRRLRSNFASLSRRSQLRISASRNEPDLPSEPYILHTGYRSTRGLAS